MSISSRLRPWLRETFAALHIPAYRVFWLAMIASFMGFSMGMVTRGFLVFDLTESNAALGAVFFAFGVPMILLALVGGVLADRLPHRQVIIVIQWMFAINVAVQAALVLTDTIEFWMILVGAVVEGVGFALVFPARQALIGDLVEDDQLGNAVALQQVSFNAGRLIVPALAGALIAVPMIGIGGTFVLQAVVLGLGAIVLMLVPLGKTVKAHREQRRASPLADVVEGVRYIRRRPAIMILILINSAGSNTIFPYVAFVPAVVSDLFDLGSVAAGRAAHHHRRRSVRGVGGGGVGRRPRGRLGGPRRIGAGVRGAADRVLAGAHLRRRAGDRGGDGRGGARLLRPQPVAVDALLRPASTTGACRPC